MNPHYFFWKIDKFAYGKEIKKDPLHGISILEN
jgi:hypothetical protein